MLEKLIEIAANSGTKKEIFEEVVNETTSFINSDYNLDHISQMFKALATALVKLRHLKEDIKIDDTSENRISLLLEKIEKLKEDSEGIDEDMLMNLLNQLSQEEGVEIKMKKVNKITEEEYPWTDIDGNKVDRPSSEEFKNNIMKQENEDGEIQITGAGGDA